MSPWVHCYTSSRTQLLMALLPHPPSPSYSLPHLLWYFLSPGWEVNTDIPFRNEHRVKFYFLALWPVMTLFTNCCPLQKKKFHWPKLIIVLTYGYNHKYLEDCLTILSFSKTMRVGSFFLAHNLLSLGFGYSFRNGFFPVGEASNAVRMQLVTLCNIYSRTSEHTLPGML